jgi:succinoglycan biosynthesis transport protein ExoP
VFSFLSKLTSAAKPASVVMPFRPDGEPDMRDLGRALWQKRTTILGSTLIAAALAFLVVNAITPRYRSEARLLLEARENVFLRAAADKSTTDRSTIDPEAVASQTQVILSRDLAREVIAKEKLTEVPEFARGAPALASGLLSLLGIGRNRDTMTLEERTLEAYYERLNVQAVEKSRVIAIDFNSSNPDLAARVANTIAQTYLRMQQTAQQDQTRAAGTWLAGEIGKMRRRVAEAEGKVEQYRTRTNLYVGPNNTSLPSQQLTEINSQIAAARARKADLGARASQLRSLIRSGQPIDTSDIANSETMRRLIEQRIALRNQLAEQSTTLLSKHPRIMELRAQIAEADRQIRSEGERLARQLDNDAKLAGDRIQTLTASLDQVKKLASQSNSQDVELRALEREAKTQRDLLESYLAKYREALARDSINAAPPDARIISRATPAIKPAYPKKLPTILIVAFAAFALSAGFTVTGALLAAPAAPQQHAGNVAPSAVAVAPAVERPIESKPEPRPRAAPPVAAPFAAEPWAERALAASRTVAPPAAVDEPAMTLSNPVVSIEQVAQDLQHPGNDGRRVTVIGAMRDVGTTYAAITLSRRLAGDVVLVDLAFNAPNLSLLSTNPSAPGIAELVRGTASFGDIITRDQYSKVHLVATGEVGNDAAMLAASPVLVTVIEALGRSYDHVVIDAGAAVDPAIERLLALAPRIVLVTRDPAGAITRAAADRLLNAGFSDFMVLQGGAQAVAAA